jgi:hypothetical protein
MVWNMLHLLKQFVSRVPILIRWLTKQISDRRVEIECNLAGRACWRVH